MRSQLKRLEWDSDFFGLDVYSFQKSILDKDDIIALIDDFLSTKKSLVYFFLDRELEFELPDGINIQLVDRKVTYLKKVPSYREVSEHIKELKMSDVHLPKAIDLAIQSGEYSRFKIDIKIPAFKHVELYEKWIINSLNKKVADRVNGYFINDELAGLVTLTEKSNRADIGIIAVDTMYRGQSIGKKLVLSAEEFAMQNDFGELQVVTQEDNLAACKFYNSCGFEQESTKYVYHLWINE
ncbi:MAG: GNAT family N-acetyltransferase [Nonlabens sp.]